MSAQLPLDTPLLAELHASHGASHGASQQKPSTQYVLLQWIDEAQASPVACPHRIPSCAQPSDASTQSGHGPKEHGLSEPPTHPPEPSQASVPVQNNPSSHGAPDRATSQAPAPLHAPEPQPGSASGHSSSGSDACSMKPHTPSDPVPFLAALHASHDPEQVVSQQTPSTQLPLRQL
jgi:hypothetical protein